MFSKRIIGTPADIKNLNNTLEHYQQLGQEAKNKSEDLKKQLEQSLNEEARCNYLSEQLLQLIQESTAELNKNENSEEISKDSFYF